MLRDFHLRMKLDTYIMSYSSWSIDFSTQSTTDEVKIRIPRKIFITLLLPSFLFANKLSKCRSRTISFVEKDFLINVSYSHLSLIIPIDGLVWSGNVDLSVIDIDVIMHSVAPPGHPEWRVAIQLRRYRVV